MTITLTLGSQLENRLLRRANRHGISVSEYAQRLLEEQLREPQDSSSAVELLQSWIDEADPVEQKETGDYVIKALDADRLAGRQLFPPELEETTW